MKGTIEKDGTVTITFNAQAEFLLAPDFAGTGCKYLPCEGCGVVLVVDMNVVSILCALCVQERGEPVDDTYARAEVSFGEGE